LLKLATPSRAPTNQNRSEVQTQDEYLDIDRIIAAFRRQWICVAVALVISVLAGLIYVFSATPQFTATTDILIDHQLSRFDDQPADLRAIMDNEASTLSQIEIIKSAAVATMVVDKLNLTESAEFSADGRSAVGDIVGGLSNVIKSMITTSSDQITDQREILRHKIIDVLREKVAVTRTGQTYVINIGYTSKSSELATSMVNAVAAAYISDQLAARSEAAERAGIWLQSRIDELRSKTLSAGDAVQKFSAENGLITTGGELVSDQQLTALNGFLVQAQDEATRVQAKYNRIQAILKSGDSDAIVSDAMGNSVITTLRASYMAASQRESEISQKLGSKHEQAVRFREEMSQYKRLIFEELGRIAESNKSELTMAQTRLDSVREQVAAATITSKSSNQTQVRLRQLQQDADNYRNLYQSYLERFQQTRQQQSDPVSSARVISAAFTPDKPSLPRKPLVLAVFILVGSSIGIGFGCFREFKDRSFRTAQQIRQQLGLGFIGYVNQFMQLTADSKSSKLKGSIDSSRLFQHQISVAPSHAIARTLKNAKMAIDQAITAPGVVVGVVSVMPQEGKSLVAFNLAKQIASEGARTLLIDANFSNRTLSREFSTTAQAGLAEVIRGKTLLSDAILTDETLDLSFLASSSMDSSEKLATFSTASIAPVLKQASSLFDYVILDLPSFGSSMDTMSFAPATDVFLLVVQWGKTSRRDVISALQYNPNIYENCLGVILNKTDRKKLAAYHETNSMLLPA